MRPLNSRLFRACDETSSSPLRFPGTRAKIEFAGANPPPPSYLPPPTSIFHTLTLVGAATMGECQSSLKSGAALSCCAPCLMRGRFSFQPPPFVRKWLKGRLVGWGSGGWTRFRRLQENEQEKQAAFIWYDKGVRGEGRRAAVMDSAYETDVPFLLLLLPCCIEKPSVKPTLSLSPSPPCKIVLYVCERVATAKRAGRKQAARRG